MSTLARWISTAEAAGVLGIDEVTLRRKCDRGARKTLDGAIEASFDGIRARKLGRLWRLLLGAGWSDPRVNGRSP